MLSFLDLLRAQRPAPGGAEGPRPARRDLDLPLGAPDRAPRGAPAGPSADAPAPSLGRAALARAPGTLIGGAPHQPSGYGDSTASRFLLRREIAEGTYGKVFEAMDTLLDRCVAIKILHARYSYQQEVVSRFTREARALAGVQHPSVVSVLEMGQHVDGSYFIVQELLTGTNLRDYITRAGRLDLHEAIAIALPIMSGLVTVHHSGIVHRDIKPENIVLARLVSGEIVPKLVDFGIAKFYARSERLTLGGYPLGTSWYMSPEQIRDASQVDARTDVWSIAAVLYEALTGVSLYGGPDDRAVMDRILAGRPRRIAEERPDLPRELAAILQRAVEPDRDARTPTMRELRDQLVDWYRRESGARWLAPIDPAPAPSPPSRAWPVEAAPAPDHGSGEGRASPAPAPPADDAPLTAAELAAAAEECLGVNALRDVIDLAERAVAADAAKDARLLARMRLYQGIAHRWLGDYAEAERCSAEAMALFQQGSAGFWAAFGHVVIARGYLGKVEQIQVMASDLAALEEEDVSAEGYVIAACRLAIFLVRTGSVDRGKAMLDAAVRTAGERDAMGPMVRAWLDVTRADLALREGDLATNVHRVFSAVENFGIAGDLRNEYLQRTNIGNASMQLGDYEQAISIFEKVLEVAQPMRLDFVSAVRVNLGVALARVGRLAEAERTEEAALAQCVQQSHLRFACVARVYLGVIRMERDDLAGAEAILSEAIDGSALVPDVRAYAYGVMAHVLLGRGQAALARERAAAAMRLLEELPGIEEGESLIRAAYATALRATGEPDEALREIRAARKRLERRADRISDPRQRESFLTRARDNALVLRLEGEWAGADS